MSGDFLLIGRIARAHGNKGQVIVNPETDFPERRYRPGQIVFVGREGSAVARELREVRFRQARPIVTLDGVETMSEAEALAGAELWIEAAGIEPLPDNTFYHHDLVGCDVIDRTGTVIGKVASVEGPMERSCLVVQGARGEVLIPLASEIVSVDLAAKRIHVDPPEGLLELNEARRPQGERSAR